MAPAGGSPVVPAEVEGAIARRRYALTLAFLLAWSLAIVVRVYDAAILHHEQFTRLLNRQHPRTDEYSVPPRGTIFDSRGRVLAISANVDSLFAIPREIKDRPATAHLLAGLLGIEEQRLACLLGVKEKPQAAVLGVKEQRRTRKLCVDRDFVWLRRRLPPDLSARIHHLALPGLHFVQERQRYYPNGSLAGQALGFVGADNVGLAGLESLYDHLLRGKPVRTVDGAESGLSSERDLHLTLDIAVQYLIERELNRAAAELKLNGATAVVLDPTSGAVVALATVPDFDPNAFAKYPVRYWRNRPIVDAFEPRSAFMFLTAAMALQTGQLQLDSPADTRHRFPPRFAPPPLPVLARPRTFGEAVTGLNDALAITTAHTLSTTQLYSQVTHLGFGAPTEIDLPGENPGILHPVRRWGRLSMVELARGQGVAVTPLQLATAYAALANGGYRYRPFLAASLRQQSLRFLTRPFSPTVCAAMMSGFDHISVDATDPTLRQADMGIPGKGGNGVGWGPTSLSPMEWYVGFAPEGRPRLLMLLVLTDQSLELRPAGASYFWPASVRETLRHSPHGRAVFSAIFREILHYYRIPSSPSSPTSSASLAGPPSGAASAGSGAGR
jgi:cell division protein FtsI (penicillin-binding protein 3)